MKTYRRILVTNFSSCPSVAQLGLCRELAQQDDSKARVVMFQDRNNMFDSDGPAGIFPPDELIRRWITDARQRVGLLLERSGLGQIQLSVLAGDPQALLVRDLKSWRPDLVIVTRGWGHARRVVSAATEAGIPIPEVMTVAPDHLCRKLLNALLPLSAEILRFPPESYEGPFHGGQHHAAG